MFSRIQPGAFVVAILALIVGLVDSGAALAQKETNTVVWGVVGSPRHLNPAVQSGVATMMPGTQIFASPLQFD